MRFASKIGLSAALAALIIGPLLGTVVFLDARSLLLERIVHEQAQIATGVMEKIDHTLLMAYEDMKLITADNFLREYLEAPSVNGERNAMVADELEERANSTGPWDGITVFNRQGRVVYAPKMMGRIGALADSPATRIAFDSALKGKSYHSDRIVCNRTGRPVVIFAEPIFGRDDADKVVGVLISHYAWATAQNVLDQVEAPATVHLLNRKGEVIGRHSGDQLHVESLSYPGVNAARTTLPGGETGYAIMDHSTHGDGAWLLVDARQRGVGDYRGSGWTLILEMPLEVMFAPIVVLTRNTVLLVVGMLLLMATLFAILGRSFIRPLAELVDGVRQVQQGHLDQKVVVRSKDEFGELADSFNAMVDQLHATQEELVSKERLAMLGQVAGSVGHELRNPLGVMSNAVYFLQTTLEGADASVKEYLGIIRDEIAGSERIVAVLMDAVRTRPPELATHGVGELIEQVLVKSAIPSSVIISQHIPATLPAVRVDAAQMQRVFDNLIANAIDAMPEGGRLEITAVENESQGTITISVRDTGSGITVENMARLFEPLFTTRARGIGLGLVVVKNLVEANGGSIEVQSEAGKGTVFSITLPCESQVGFQPDGVDGVGLKPDL